MKLHTSEIDFSKINFPTSLNVTDQSVDISMLTENQKQYYINLLKEIIEIYTDKQKTRLVVGFAGPSGAGKSVTVQILKELSQQISLNFKIETMGIDAYSYKNSFLLTNFDGGKSLKDYKGRYDTYDVAKLIKDLQCFCKGEKVSIPVYSRKTHDPIENFTTIHCDNILLLVEGLWLLSEKNNWERVRDFLDFTFFVSADKDKSRELTIKRHSLGGRSLEDSSLYYEAVDVKNFDLVIGNREEADKIIQSYYCI